MRLLAQRIVAQVVVHGFLPVRALRRLTSTVSPVLIAGFSQITCLPPAELMRLREVEMVWCAHVHNLY